VVDTSLRKGDLESALDVVDPLVLEPLGVTQAEIAGLRRARQKLSGRRRSRGRTQSGEAKKDTPEANRRTSPSRSRSRCG
jgi:hypothetical protein